VLAVAARVRPEKRGRHQTNILQKLGKYTWSGLYRAEKISATNVASNCSVETPSAAPRISAARE